jgi:hypothetical protein
MTGDVRASDGASGGFGGANCPDDISFTGGVGLCGSGGGAVLAAAGDNFTVGGGAVC